MTRYASTEICQASVMTGRKSTQKGRVFLSSNSSNQFAGYQPSLTLPGLLDCLV